MPPRQRPPPCAPDARGKQEQVNAAGQSQLWRAASLGNLAWVHSLLSSGEVLIDRHCNQGGSPLFTACQHGQLEVVRTLLSAGALVDLTTPDGISALWTACQHGHLEVVRPLLSAGALVDLAHVVGGTPLYKACQNGHLEVARALLSAGA